MKFPLQVYGTGTCKGLWLHGWLGSGQEGKDLQQALGDGHGLCCPDLPGHGENPLEGWTLSTTLEAIAEEAQHCEWAGGYSMGGRLLMLAAARHPDAFRKLVIESASLGLADEKERAQRRELDQQRARKLKSAGLTAFCEDWYAMEMWGGLDKLPPRQGNEAGLAGALNLFSVGNQPDLRQWLRFSSCRVLWLAGSRDAVYVENAKWVRQHCHHPVKILAAGHNVHLQQPHAWGEAVRNFLERGSGYPEQ
jgi:2-succinyl-6-hydroxy-2,4-cyclohexadiene-1-carboxylate synthase